MKEHPILMSADMVRAILAGKKTVTRRAYKDPAGPSFPEFIGYEGEESDLDQWITGWSHRSENGEMVTLAEINESGPWNISRYGQVGDRLWVRESFDIIDRGTEHGSAIRTILYRATNDEIQPVRRDHPIHAMAAPKRYPSIFMPRWAARLTLEIVSIRVERLHAITKEDAIAEGALEWASDPELTGRAYDNRMNLWCRYTRRTDPDSGAATARGAYALLWDTINAKRGFDWDSNPWVWRVEFRVVEEAADAH